ncbi:hypothetical protein T11_13074 [Trichinella zimbabwensis]|uniref:Uncharacterized protein n=1 Tax=Trichinella zimbabwensis TaxID=268475 RepID=A0A0V1I5X2_9BILA|nr:hypothetical protein T11_13074 [Trichinella zimbabwensis]
MVNAATADRSKPLVCEGLGTPQLQSFTGESSYLLLHAAPLEGCCVQSCNDLSRHPSDRRSSLSAALFRDPLRGQLRNSLRPQGVCQTPLFPTVIYITIHTT